jgi:hypothetical protein
MSGWIVDWVDHIIPCAHGGSADLNNGVCASDFFNTRKSDNIDDDRYLIKHGKVTEYYHELLGDPPAVLTKQLHRLSRLNGADWYFNRSIVGILVGYDYRCDKEFKGKEVSRKDVYWFKSAWNRLQKFQKIKSSSIIERHLIKEDKPFGVDLLLQLEEIKSEPEFYELVEFMYPIYRENYMAIYNYYKMGDIPLAK